MVNTCNRIDFTGYTGSFDCASYTLSDSGDAVFASGMTTGATGSLSLIGPKNHALMLKSNATHPGINAAGSEGITVVVSGVIFYGVYRIVYRQSLNRPVAIGVCFILSLLWKLFGRAGKELIVQSGRQKMMYGVLAGAVLLLLWLQIFANLIIFDGIIIARHSGKYPEQFSMRSKPSPGAFP
jgi:uncharacterized BrkB/YihY/UPF0761 family membrane protein